MPEIHSKPSRESNGDMLILSCLNSISNNGGTFATPIAEQVIGNG